MKRSTSPKAASTRRLRRKDPEEIAGERRRLFELIEERARTEGVPLTRLTREKFGIGFSYYASLKSGAGNIRNSMDFLERCAAYLRLPLVHVLMSAGVLKLEDFATRLALKQYVDLGYFRMTKDPACAGVVPDLETWEASPMQTKAFTVLVYDAYFSQKMGSAARKELPDIPQFEAAQLLLRQIIPQTAAEEPVRDSRKRA
jgi:hypothetical protein